MCGSSCGQENSAVSVDWRGPQVNSSTEVAVSIRTANPATLAVQDYVMVWPVMTWNIRDDMNTELQLGSKHQFSISETICWAVQLVSDGARQVKPNRVAPLDDSVALPIQAQTAFPPGTTLALILDV
jgi:hypothetical protein